MILFETLLEVFAMIVAWAFSRYAKPVAFKWIIFVLTITAINEAVLVPWIVSHHPNSINVDYNIYSLLDMYCWFAFFFGIFTSRLNRSIVLAIAIANFVCSLTEIIFIRQWVNILSYSHILYDFSIIGIALLYLYTLLKKDYHHLWTDPVFWTASACILYHIILIPNFASFTETREFWQNLFSHINYNILQNFGNTTYYLLLSVAFFVNYYNYKQKQD